MRTVTRFEALGLAIAAAVGAWWLRSAGADPLTEIGAAASIVQATPEQVGMVRWAVGRFEAAGLEAPWAEIHFHGDAAGCGGHLGYARAGRADVCTTLANPMTRRNLLHEMSHLWLDQNVNERVRDDFLEFTGVGSWNDPSDTWALRGYEQGAEIISWTIGERILGPQIPDDDPRVLDVGYELLTGVRSPGIS